MSTLTDTHRAGITALAQTFGAPQAPDLNATDAALTALPAEQRAGLLHLLEAMQFLGLGHQPLHLARLLVRITENISSDARGGMDGWRDLTGAAPQHS